MSGIIRHKLVNVQNPLNIKLMENAFHVMHHFNGKPVQTHVTLRSMHALPQ